MKIIQCDHCQKQIEADQFWGGPKSEDRWNVVKEGSVERQFCTLNCVADYYAAQKKALEAMTPVSPFFEVVDGIGIPKF